MPGYELFGEDERRAVNELFDANGGVLFAHGFLGQRKGVFKVREFEGALAKAFAVPHCQVVSSGSAALLVAMKALGVKPGDEVITSSFTFVATVEAIIESGGVPVLTEIDSSYNMDPADLEAKITAKTRLIVPVHMAGAPARMDEILAVARAKGIPVLEDSAQAAGGTYRGRPLGTLGDAGIFSFDFAKNITTGEGGAILTASEETFRRCRELHDHGHEYNPAVPRGKDTRRMGGFNYRMTELQAAIGLVQLKKLPRLLEAQRRNAAALREALKGLPLTLRDSVDAGEIADTVIFAVKDQETALAVAARLGQAGLGTKNLPDAVDWHFAGTWTHMLGESCRVRWPRTRALLERSVALPVNALAAPGSAEAFAAAVADALGAKALR